MSASGSSAWTGALVGIAIAFALGVLFGWLRTAVPAPPNVPGALMVVALTLGYIAGSRLPSFRDAPGPPVAERPAAGPDAHAAATAEGGAGERR